MKKEKLHSINLQLFAGDTDNEEVNVADIVVEEAGEAGDNSNDVSGTNTENDTQLTDTVTELDKLKKANKDKLDKLALSKVQELEEANKNLENKLSNIENLLKSLATGEKINQAKIKPAPATEEDINKTLSDEILLNEVSKLNNELKKRDERDFINEQLKNKPYVADAVKKAKITTKADYIRFILPLEEDYKEKAELAKKINANQDRDLFSEYGFVIPKSTEVSAYKKQQDEAAILGGSIIDDLLF